MAGGSGAIKAGRAFVEIFADDTRLQRGLARAQARLKAFGAAVTQMGKQLVAASAAIVGALTGAVLLFSKVGDSIAKMAARTGLSVEALSALAFAADQSGTSIEDLEKAVLAMNRVIEDAATGVTTAIETLAKLGLTIDEILALSPEERFKLIADRLSLIEDPTLRAALAMEIFGKSGAKLLPLISGGAAGIDALMAKARQLGLVMDAETARKAEILNDALGQMFMTLKQIAFNVGAALAPVFTGLADAVSSAAVAVGGWIRENERTVAIVLAVGAAIGALGAGLIALGVSIKITLGLFAALGAAIAVVKGLFIVLASVIGAALTPVGLLIAAIVALGVVVVQQTGAMGAAIDWLGNMFRSLGSIAGETIDGMVDALTAGDVVLAAQVMWAGLKAAWLTGVKPLRELWADLNFFMLELWTNTAATFQSIWAQAVNFVSDLILEVMGLFDEALDVEAAKAIGRQQLEADLREIEDARQRTLEAGAEEHARRLEEAQSDLDRAIQALRESRERAARRRAERTGSEPAAPQVGEIEVPDLGDLVDALTEQIADTPAAIQQRTEARGTFNAAAIQGLQAAADDGDEGTHQRLDLTNDTLRSMFREIRDNPGLLFE